MKSLVLLLLLGLAVGRVLEEERDAVATEGDPANLRFVGMQPHATEAFATTPHSLRSASAMLAVTREKIHKAAIKKFHAALKLKNQVRSQVKSEQQRRELSAKSDHNKRRLDAIDNLLKRKAAFLKEVVHKKKWKAMNTAKQRAKEQAGKKARLKAQRMAWRKEKKAKKRAMNKAERRAKKKARETVRKWKASHKAEKKKKLKLAKQLKAEKKQLKRLKKQWAEKDAKIDKWLAQKLTQAEKSMKEKRNKFERKKRQSWFYKYQHPHARKSSHRIGVSAANQPGPGSQRTWAIPEAIKK